MQLVELRKWSVRCEPDLTREAYALMDSGGAELCGCEACFNFATTRHLLYSAEVLEFLELLGVDPLLEAGVSHDACLGDGRHGYTACFYLVGEIAQGPATTVARAGGELCCSRESAGGGIAVGFSSPDRDVPDAFRGLPVVCLEVSVVAPWVSNAPEPHFATS
ncbi:MAG: hypothetical protein ACQGVC_11235 [Myxococcota bacterium]